MKTLNDSEPADEPQAHKSSFDKGLSVLSWLLDHDNLRADQIAAALGLPVSSVYRYLRALRVHGFVTDRDSVYTTGPRLGGETTRETGGILAAAAMPFLHHLSQVTGETALVTVRHGLHAVCLRQVESRHQIRLAFEVGELLPLYAGAGERAILAFAPEEVQRAVLQGQLRSFTPQTPSKAELPRMLARVRADGIAVSHGEMIPGSYAMAMPVVIDRYARAAVCVAGPRNRCTGTWQETARAELAAAVRSLTRTIVDRRTQ